MRPSIAVDREPDHDVVYFTDVEGSWQRFASFFAPRPGVAALATLDADDQMALADGVTLVFGGDAIDRGDASRRIVRCLLSAKARYGQRVVLLAGNRDINKWRLVRELAGHPPKKAPSDVAQAPLPELLRWIFNHTMGAHDAFALRQQELAREGVAHDDDAVVASFIADLAPDGDLMRYGAACQLAYVSGQTLFVHGGIAEEALTVVPHAPVRRLAAFDLGVWLRDLDAFFASQVDAVTARRLNSDGTPAWEDAIIYQAPRKGTHSNPGSVIYGRMSDEMNNPILPDAPVMAALRAQGIARIVVGHTPSGDVPVIVKRSGPAPFEVITADNSRGRLNQATHLRVRDDTVEVHGTTLIDGGHTLPRHVDMVHRFNDPHSPIGQRESEGYVVVGKVDTDSEQKPSWLLFRYQHGYRTNQIERSTLNELHDADVPMPGALARTMADIAMQAQYCVGIDLGTTNTVVAAAKNDSVSIEDFAILQHTAPGETQALSSLPSVIYRADPSEIKTNDAALPWQKIPERPDFVGAFAKQQSDRVPGRGIMSAKSWLSVRAVDAEAAILPWGQSDAAKLSPVDVQARILTHVQRAWDQAHKDAPLAFQDVTVTIPASFDEAARELTLKSCKKAGLPHVRLLEEPQAALYAYLSAHSHHLHERLQGVRLLLVVDVGGGTTDLSLVRVDAAATPGALPVLSRVAVGDHLMLGGDNMDVTLGKKVESTLAGAVGALDATSWGGLLSQARLAKEQLLGEHPPAHATLTLSARGRSLVSQSKAQQVSTSEVEALLLDGFFPVVDAHATPDKKKAAITELSLPYERDAAITRHLVAFLRQHQQHAAEAGARVHDGVAVPDAVLLNGGVFKSPRIRERLTQVLAAVCGNEVRVLDVDHAALDAAVARGAAYAGLVRQGKGVRIGGGSGRAYFVGLGGEGQGKALCVVPHGLHEGERLQLAQTFQLRVDQPVSFALYTSTHHRARAGEIVDVDDTLDALPPLSAVLSQDNTLPVQVEAFLSEVGTLELSLKMTNAALKRFSLAFSTRTEGLVKPNDPSDAERPLPKPVALHAKIDEARELVLAFYGNKSKDVDKSKVKDLRRDLEKLLGARETWTAGTNRELCGALLSGHKNRRRSVEHERVFFQMVGFTLRPGVGVPFDDWRIEQLWPLFAEGISFTSEKPTWASFFILWRRVAGGLSAAQQAAVWAYLEPWLLLEGTGQKGQGPKPHGLDEMVRLAASLERLPVSDKTKLLHFVQKKLGRGSLESAWALGRIAARRPLFGKAHDVLTPDVVLPVLERLLALPDDACDGLDVALCDVAEMTGDRSRDFDDATRARVVKRLQLLQQKAKKGTPDRGLIARVTSVQAHSAADDALAFGEALPPGLLLEAERTS